MRKIAFGAVVFVAAAISLMGSKKLHALASPNNSQPQIVVQSGDSLSSLATSHNTTYPRLFYANTQVQNPNLIHPGDILRIPGPAEQLPERPLPLNTPAPSPPQRAVTFAAPVAPSASTEVWDRLAQCESGGNWSLNTGNGYYGGLQFSLTTWQRLGGSGYPNEASKSEQIARGQLLQTRSGWGAWPACANKLGL